MKIITDEAAINFLNEIQLSRKLYQEYKEIIRNPYLSAGEWDFLFKQMLFIENYICLVERQLDNWAARACIEENLPWI